MKAHIHAELMMEYAKDAMETDKPWERWEFNIDNEWKSMFRYGHPLWDDDTKYRRKPITININGHEVPEPYRGEMKAGQPYYTPELYNCGTDYWEVYHDRQWENGIYDNVAMKNGLLHLTEDAAIKHAKALLSFTEL
jgi:hypothetical protein